MNAWRVMVVALALVLAGSAARGEEPAGSKSLEDIVGGLIGAEGERGFKKPAAPGAPEGAGAAAPNPRIAVPIQFEYNSAEISASSQAQLETIAQALNSEQLRSFRIRIEGHTDDRGSAEYNQSLSDRRANAVRRYLIERLGVAPSRLEARGYGESQPLAGVSQETDEGRAQNRRVELVNLSLGSTAKAAPAPAVPASKPSVRVVVNHKKEGRVQVLEPGGALASNEEYRISFTPGQNGYVYLYQIDSTGKVQPIFPNPDLSPLDNPVQAQRSYSVPPDGQWLKLDANRGEEQIVAIASKNKLADPKGAAFSAWNQGDDALGGTASRGVAPAPRPGRAAGGSEDMFMYRLPFKHQ